MSGSAEAGAVLAELLAGPAETVAPRLLGAVLRHGEVAVRLTEVEAYAGEVDPGSHAYRGRTKRNATMFGEAGHLYCYFTYGMHVCANLVTGTEGTASAVLLRAGEIVSGVAIARDRRPRSSDRDLARGPARLCTALGIALAHDGVDVTREPFELRLADEPAPYVTGPRVGLRGAADWPWRFWIPGEPTVSAYRAAKPR